MKITANITNKTAEKRDIKFMAVYSYTIYCFSVLSFLLKFYLKQNGRNLLLKKNSIYLERKKSHM